MVYKIFCKTCKTEISWSDIPFFSVEFCNLDCSQAYREKLISLGEIEATRKVERSQARSADPDRYFKPKPRKDSPHYEKWAKQKAKCEYCSVKYRMGDGYSPRFCSLLCGNANHNKITKEYNARKKLEKSGFKESAKCLGCEQTFTKTHEAQKHCSGLCLKKKVIKKSNKIWVERDLKELERKRAARNRRIGQLLNADHVREKEWAGKKFKAVRG